MSLNASASIANYQRPVDLLDISRRQKPEAAVKESGKASFKEMFSRELAGSRNVSFSKHASARLFSRGIELSDGDVTRIADAVDKAGSKGSRETLVLAKDYALVVSVEDRTVVTAFGRDNLRDGVVTSIDSAVIL
jgi:flagellar operon protein